MTKNKFELASELQTQYYKVLKEIKEEDFLELFRPMFDQFPQILAVGWVQYTPSFNDGDPCTFRMGEFYPIMATVPVVSDEEDEEEDDDDSSDEVMTVEKAHELSGRELESNSDLGAFTAVEGLEKVFWDATRQISHDIAERVFGDGTCVVISKEKVTTNDYYCGY